MTKPDTCHKPVSVWIRGCWLWTGWISSNTNLYQRWICLFETIWYQVSPINLQVKRAWNRCVAPVLYGGTWIKCQAAQRSHNIYLYCMWDAHWGPAALRNTSFMSEARQMLQLSLTSQNLSRSKHNGVFPWATHTHWKQTPAKDGDYFLAVTAYECWYSATLLRRS